ncbi:MAG: carboxypeptidase regulatory-like domain-containing protein [Bacteroidota bacterium]|nr:carboxypeptidase regulatory-like domain-containing protein [Bacteroidota bacterium]MDP4211134.1 carboxypeptidase regulatory-like domain-containing protein [Bacteroidota bacterium]MDP4249467.1 carboxypeptidase regulatory-like domain-containing protein [Bacteroidota bacterium]
MMLVVVWLPILLFPAFKQAKKTGIEGYIFWVSGNRMPSPDVKLSPPKGIQATLYIYELTNLNQLTRVDESAFYSGIKTRLVRTTESDTSGYFSVSLPPGQYSLFTKKDALFYANYFDGQNNVAPVKVIPGKVTQVNVNVDYAATY